ncbi:MAG: sigma-70 family RNA polymerase sigma factor [Acidobacteriota bacterium]|nr:sigma-70 family RNA polymerase sigma factor [Acidobacteriota bacterium]
MDPNPPEGPAITSLLQRWSQGETGVADEIFHALYDELHKIADGFFARESEALTLQATAVLHEAYLRLALHPPSGYENRTHFLGLAARVMRQVLVDHARSRCRDKRGGGVRPFSLSEDGDAVVDSPEALLTLHRALEKLGREDPQKEEIVTARFFGGLTQVEIADSLGISRITVQRQWRRARAWLYAELVSGTGGSV